MGIYDRDYYQEEERKRWDGERFGGGRSVVVNLILVNVAIYVADLLFNNRINEACALQSDVFRRPWLCWQLLTYGFLHDPKNLLHIAFNMLGLWVFGRELEGVYGKAEFLRIYLVAIVVSGLAWAATAAFSGGGILIGASGGVICIVVLFALHFPRRTVLFMAIIPMPAWVLASMYVLFDLFAIGSDDLVAHVAHLGGAAFGFIYYRAGMNLGRMVPRRFSLGSLRIKPKLRIHDPDAEQRKLNQQVDRILEKISREGEASLTKSERRTLEDASRRYQRRRQ